MKNQNETEIDLLELFHYLKKRLWIIAAAVGACALLGLVVSTMFMTPMYTASTRVYVLNQANDNNVAYSDFQVSSQLLNDYKVLITGQNVTREVVTELGLNMTPGQLTEKIKVTAPDNTRVLQISVTDADPQRAADIANAVREVAALQLQKIMDVDAVNLVYEAEVPTTKSSPSVKRNVMLAIAAGLVVSVGVLAIVFICDDRIRTEEDVEHYLGLSTLGVIPLSKELDKAKSQPTRKHIPNGIR